MRQPDALGISRRGHAIDEADFRRIGVGVGQHVEIPDGAAGQGEFGVEFFDPSFWRAWRLGGLRPLAHEIVLNARNRAVDEVAFARKRFDVRDVIGGEVRRHLDDDPTLSGEVHVQRVFGIEGSPF